MVGIVLRSRMERWWLKVDKQCKCLVCVGKKLWKGPSLAMRRVTHVTA